MASAMGPKFVTVQAEPRRASALAVAAVTLQKCFRGMQARKKADRQWSDEVQHNLRAMRISIRRGNVRERKRMGHKVTHWAQQQLGLLNG